MNIFFSGLVVLLLGWYIEINLIAANLDTQISTMLTVVLMGSLIRYDNRKSKEK